MKNKHMRTEVIILVHTCLFLRVRIQFIRPRAALTAELFNYSACLVIF